MFEFLLADANLPFTLALALMLGIALLEGLGLLAGFDISRTLDDLLFDAGFQVETGASEAPGAPAFLAWLLFPSYSEVFMSLQNSCFIQPSFTAQSN